MLKAGMGQEIPFHKCQFGMKKLESFELFKGFHTYSPLVISMNYQRRGKMYAFITYACFTKDGNGHINGAHTFKQLVIVIPVA